MNAAFVKYPRTPMLFRERSDARSMDKAESLDFIRHPGLIIEEKMDGTCIGISFQGDKLFCQNRGDEITHHPQFDLFKTWIHSRRDDFWDLLTDRYIMFGEWLYLRHSIEYDRLPHYFMEFDIYDKEEDEFLDTETRVTASLGIVEHASVIHRGPIQDEEELSLLMGYSLFGNSLSEGLYLKIEEDGVVKARAKYVRPGFVKEIITSEHWIKKKVRFNQLREGVNIWKPF